jgi:hypothetical protein
MVFSQLIHKRITLASFFIGAVLFLIPLATNSSESLSPPLKPLFAQYHSSKTYAFFFKDSATRRLNKLKNGHWLYQLDISSFFARIKESVEFEWRNQRIYPLIYKYDRTGLNVSNRHALLRFDWLHKIVTNRVQGSEWKMAITDNTWDKLSYQLQLKLDLMQHKNKLRYDIADGGHLKQYIFKVSGTDKIDTPMGRIRATRVDVVKKTGRYQNTELWFANQWDFLLTKMVQTDSQNNKIEIQLDYAEINGQPLE